MHNYNLGFISNEDIYSHVKQTVEAYRREITLSQFNENIIDPIKLTFDAKVYGKTIQQAVEDECFRQIDKSNTNKIGYFHQNIFRYAGNGWVVPSVGFDVQNDEKHIYVVFCDKYISMNSPLCRKIYLNMQTKLLDDDKATCYLVDINSRLSCDNAWNVYLNGKQYQHRKIRRISTDKFYSIIFNDNEAYSKLCKILPQIIDDVLKDSPNLVYKPIHKLHGLFEGMACDRSQEYGNK